MSTQVSPALYASPATARAMADYQRRERRRFPSVSAAGDHLLGRALQGELDEGMEGLLAPLLERAVREATREEVADAVKRLLERQTNRLAALLVQSGKDAHRAAGLGLALLERQTGDRGRAAEIARDVELRAGARYSRAGVRGTGGR